MKARGKRRLGGVRMRVEARRAHKKSNNRYPFLDLDFDEDEPPTPGERALYVLATVVCVVLAIVGAIFPVLPAIPFWVLGAISLSHAFPPFGRFLRSTRLYRWLIEKLNEPQEKARRPIMEHRRKDVIMTRVSVGMALLLAASLVLPLARYVRWGLRAVVSLAWVASWCYLYLYVRDPEATIRGGSGR